MKTAAIIPCYRVKAKILSVLESMPAEVTHIFVVDDACPEGSGDAVEKGSSDMHASAFCDILRTLELAPP